MFHHKTGIWLQGVGGQTDKPPNGKMQTKEKAKWDFIDQGSKKEQIISPRI